MLDENRVILQPRQHVDDAPKAGPAIEPAGFHEPENGAGGGAGHVGVELHI